VAAVVLSVWGVLRLEPNMADPFQWVPDRSPERVVYERFRSDFGVDDFLVARWPGCRVTDSRCDRFVAELEAADDAGTNGSLPGGDLIADATSGRDVLRRLAGIRSAGSGLPSDGADAAAFDRAALRRPIPESLRGVYFAQEGNGTCVIVTLTSAGMSHRREAVDRVTLAAARAGVPAESLAVAGHPVFTAYGDELIARTLLWAFLPCCAITALVAYGFLGSARSAAATLLVSATAAGLSIAAVTLTGAPWSGISTIIPTLIYILTTSGSLHLLHYSRAAGNAGEAGRAEDGSAQDGPGEKASALAGGGARALRAGWVPCSLSATTTAAGMLPLCRSEFPVIREFGLYCAAGVVASLSCQLLLMPAAIDRFRLNPPPLNRWRGSTRWPGRLIHASGRPFVLLNAALRRPRTTVLAAGVVATIAALGLPRLDSHFGVDRLFSEETKVRRDAAQLAETLGPLSQTELAVRFTGVDVGGFPQRCVAVRALQERLEARPEVQASYSAAAWLPPPPSETGLRGVLARNVYRRGLLRARDELVETSRLAVRPDGETWRVTVRFTNDDADDFDHLRAAVDEVVRTVAPDADAGPVPTAFPTRDPAGPGALDEPRGLFEGVGAERVAIDQTGILFLYSATQGRLLEDLRNSLLGAFLLICPAMAFTLRSVRLGLLVMLPNVLPVLMLFGAMGWGGVPVDLSVAVTSCVALGIAIDDTTHFAVRFRTFARTGPPHGVGHAEEDDDGAGPAADDPPGSERLRAAIRAAFAECSPAMIATTVTVTAGLIVFLFTPLLAMSRFAVTLMWALWLALLCDLLLLPPLLALSARARPARVPPEPAP